MMQFQTPLNKNFAAISLRNKFLNPFNFNEVEVFGNVNTQSSHKQVRWNCDGKSCD